MEPVQKSKIELQQQKILQKKQKLQAMENRLKEKERKRQVKELIQLGTLVKKSGLSSLEMETLLGALLTLKDKKENSEILSQWKTKGMEALQSNEKEKNALIISFEEEIPLETKNQLKGLKFKWNSFRKEWYGYGSKNEMQKLLEGLRANIQSLTFHE